MRASTTQLSNNTHEARFLAPETHQRAGAEPEKLSFRSILEEALSKPGMLNTAYRAFHNYSVGNQMLAAMQLMAKGLPLSPIASFIAWKTKGRMVRKGQRAISLSMPVPVKRSSKSEDTKGTERSDAAGDDKASTFNVFMLRPNWFSLDQTEGDDFVPELKAPSWDAAQALATLDVAEVPFFSYCEGTSSATRKAGRLR